MGLGDCSCGCGFRRYGAAFANQDLIDLNVGDLMESPSGCGVMPLTSQTVKESTCSKGSFSYPQTGEYAFNGKDGDSCKGCEYSSGCRCDNSRGCNAVDHAKVCAVNRIAYKGNPGACCLLGGGNILTSAPSDTSSADIDWSTVNGTTYTCDPTIQPYSSTPVANCGKEVTNICSRQDSQTWKEWYASGGQCGNWANVGSVGYSAVTPVLSASLSNFYTQYGTIDQPNNPEAQMYIDSLLNYCTKYPGACDTGLDKLCANLTRDDIETANTAMRNNSSDLNSSNLVGACGCHLPPTQYAQGNEGSTDQGRAEVCDPLCLLPGTVKVGVCSDKGCSPAQCQQSVCEMDNISVSVINSNAGNINFQAMCGSCPPGTCECVFSNISVHSVGSNVGNIDFEQQCGGGCSVVDPSTNLPVPIDCTTGKALSDSPSGQPSNPPSSSTPSTTKGWFKKYGKTILIALAVIIAILFIVVIVSVFSSKKKTSISPSDGTQQSSTSDYKNYVLATS